MGTRKDPKDALGPSEGLHFLAHKGFSAKHPEVAKFISGIKLNDQKDGSLQNMVVNKYGKGDGSRRGRRVAEAEPQRAARASHQLTGFTGACVHVAPSGRSGRGHRRPGTLPLRAIPAGRRTPTVWRG